MGDIIFTTLFLMMIGITTIWVIATVSQKNKKRNDLENQNTYEDTSTEKNQGNKEEDYMTMGMSLGMCFGVLIGSAFKNTFGINTLTYGICFGMLTGMLAGMLIGMAIKKK